MGGATFCRRADKSRPPKMTPHAPRCAKHKYRGWLVTQYKGCVLDGGINPPIMDSVSLTMAMPLARNDGGGYRGCPADKAGRKTPY